MRVVKPSALGLLSRPFEHGRRFQLGLSVLCFVPLGAQPMLYAETAMWDFLPAVLPPEQAIDVAIPKSGSEFLVVGSAFAPGGASVPALRASVRLGERSKSLNVFGDRHWLAGDRPSQPVPFATMPLDWAHAYGGPGDPDNPLGKGLQPIATPDGNRVPLPNVIDPSLGAAAYRHAAGFGPRDVAWRPRAQLAGTHDDRWLQDDFPGFPRDIDWRFFNLAPEDQQFPHPLLGDESYALENLHPEHPLLEGRLPGIAPRAFVVRESSGGFEEVPLALTTVWFFPQHLRLVLVHHGRAVVAEEDAADVARIVIGADLLRAPRPATEFRAVMEKRLDKEWGAIYALRDADLAPAALIVPDPELEKSMAEATGEGLQQKHARLRQEREHSRARNYLASLDLGVPLDELLPPLPPEQKPPALEALPAYIEQVMAQAEQAKAEAEATRAARDTELDDILEGSGMTAAEFRARRDAKPSGPPEFTAAVQRQRIEQAIADCHAAGFDPAALEAIVADPATIAQWEQAERQVREAYRLSAQHQDPAKRIDPARNAEIRRVLAAGMQPRAPADLTGTDLSGLDLSGAALDDAWLDGADLTGTNLAGAHLARAVLAHAKLDGANLDGADLTGANLGRAFLSGTNLRGAKLNDAVLNYAVLDRAVLRQADLTGASLLEAVLRGVDLSGARAPKVTFLKLTIVGLNASGAVLDQAQFIECDLSAALFSRASLVRTLFLKCPLRGADFSEATLHKTVFVEGCDLASAVFVRAVLTEANLRGMRMPGADFSQAVLDKSDLSKCDLTAARLPRVRAVGTQFVAAILAGADLTHGNFMQAGLARADLRGAILTEAGLFEADMARVRIDAATRTERMITARMRYLPRYRTHVP